MKTKIILILLVSLMLIGCGGSNNTAVASKEVYYWTEIDRQEGGLTRSNITTYKDAEGHILVVAVSGNGTAAVQIK